MLALIGERLALERQLDDLQAFLEQLAGIEHVEPEGLELGGRAAPPEAQAQRPLGQVGKDGDLLGHPQRMIPGGDDDSRAQPEIGVLGRDVGQDLERVGGGVVIGEMMLDQPRRVVTQRIAEIGVRHHVLVELGVGRAVVADRSHHPAEGRAGGAGHVMGIHLLSSRFLVSEDNVSNGPRPA